jgi:hypothetical protein
MSFTLPSLRIGKLFVLGNEATHGQVLIEAAAPINGMATIRLDGLCKTISRDPTPSQIEISATGTLCLTSGAFFDVCIRDESLFPMGAYATVSVSRDSFLNPLSRALRETPIITTLVSHGLPFSFSVHSVSVTNCALGRQAMQLTFRGVLFGYRFDVTSTMCSPDNTPEMMARICEGLAAHIIEQCNESLWSSIDTFVGCIHDVSSDGEEESGTKVRARVAFEDDTPNVNSASGSKGRGARARDSTLISLWLDRESYLIDEMVGSSVDVM